MSETRYYYICDDCGDIVDIAASAHEPGDRWICVRCDDDGRTGDKLSVFTDKNEATTYADRIMGKRYAAELAQLDQAKARARADEKRRAG